jgi:hypothetical protein
MFSLDADLLNSAFEFAINAHGKHAEAKDRLQQRFPHTDFDAIAEAYSAACRLHDLI